MEYDAKAWLRCGRCCSDGGAVGRRSHEVRIPSTCEGLNGASVEPGTGAEGISGAANCLSLQTTRYEVEAWFTQKRNGPTAPIRKGESRITHDRPPTTYSYCTVQRYAAFTGCERRQRFSCSARTGKYLKVEVCCHRICTTVRDDAQPLHNSSGVSLNLGSETRPCLAYM
jgi:hypothetical protein